MIGLMYARRNSAKRKFYVSNSGSGVIIWAMTEGVYTVVKLVTSFVEIRILNLTRDISYLERCLL
jgi:hypothetical protein